LVGSITTSAGLGFLAASSSADAVEVRCDALMGQVDALEEALKHRQKPVLLTLRALDEGGYYSWSYGEREALFQRLMPYADAIDLELASPLEMEPVLELAQSLQKPIVLSAHSINHPASAGQVEGWLRRYHEISSAADVSCIHILKLAGRINDQKDVRRLARVLVEHDFPVAVMGLGPLAAPSRVLFTQLGSRLVYGYLDQAAAQGQPSIDELRKSLSGMPFTQVVA
jgi:3-dehydroquinate dehydratase-1